MNRVDGVSPDARWRELYVALDGLIDALRDDFENAVRVLDGQGAA